MIQSLSYVSNRPARCAGFLLFSSFFFLPSVTQARPYISSFIYSALLYTSIICHFLLKICEKHHHLDKHSYPVFCIANNIKIVELQPPACGTVFLEFNLVCYQKQKTACTHSLPSTVEKINRKT